MLRVELLPAERGDCILVEYGTGTEPDHRVLIDGGPVNSGLYEGVRNRLLQVPVGQDGKRHFELLVISHIDADHIEGVIAILQDQELAASFDDIWFNGWRHIVPFEPADAQESLGAANGEFLSALIDDGGLPWNAAFGGKAVVVPDDEKLPHRTLPGGLELTLVSPTPEKLGKLVRAWRKEIKRLGFTPGDLSEAREQLQGKWWARVPASLGDGDDQDEEISSSHDRSEANGSSIAFVAKWQGRSVLLAADAHDDVLTASLRRFDGAGPAKFDAVKLSHHGSEHNTTRQLLGEFDTTRYLVSSNGNRFSHPNPMTVLTLAEHHESIGAATPEIWCNYRQEQTTIWESSSRVVTHFGNDGHLTLELEPKTPEPAMSSPVFFDSAQTVIHHRVTGSGFPVLLIAPGGMRSHMAAWDSMPWNPRAALADDFMVVAMDQRNAGRSWGPITGADGWDTYRADQLALMDHLGFDRFAIVGMCIGGPYIAGLCRAVPDRVAAAISLQPIGLDNNRDAFHNMFDDWRGEVAPAHPEADDAAFDSFRSNMYDGEFLFNTTRDQAAQIETPTLIAMGNDLFHPESTSRELADLMPNATLIEDWKEGAALAAADQRFRSFLAEHTP